MSGEPEEVFGDDESPTPLATRADVRRALAKHLRRLQKGTVPHDLGQVLITGYATIAKLMVEDEVTDVARRLKRIEERAAAH